MADALKELTGSIIGAAIDVHRELGPGLLESAYEECLAVELGLRGIRFVRQHPVAVVYKGRQLECCYRVDFLVEERVIVELKAVNELHPVFEAQILTYLRLTKCSVGLLINFSKPTLKEGLQRFVLGHSSALQDDLA